MCMQAELFGNAFIYRAIFTQTDAGGGAIKVDFNLDPDNEAIVQYVKVTAGDLAVASTIRVGINDSNDAEVLDFDKLSMDNNSHLFCPRPGDALGTASLKIDSTHPYNRIFQQPNYLTVETDANIAQNEQIVVLFKLRTRYSQRPTISTSRSTGTIDTSLTYASTTS